MAPKNKNILLQLIDRHHKLGIAEQINYDKIYLKSANVAINQIVG